MKRIITFGTFDLFHIGHLNLLRNCKEKGDYLIVGVSSDELNKLKGKETVIPLTDRIQIIQAIKYVDEVFVEDSLDEKNNYIHKYNADMLIMGDDWIDKFNWVDCEVLYLPRTPNISSSALKTVLQNYLC